MIEILHSRDPSTIALVFSGKATEQDAEVLDGYVKVSFKEDEKFNILAIMKDVDGSTFKGMIDGVTFDMKRWSQFNKFAVISEKDWIGFMTMLGNYLPGIKAKYFEEHQLEEAWDWIVE